MINVEVHGVAFHVVEDEHAEFWDTVNSGRWESETFEILDRLVSPCTTVLDVGGWIGPTALYAARRARQVFVFEPDPAAFDTLIANLRANPDLTNVEAIPAFVWTKRETVTMGAFFKPGDSGSSILFAGNQQNWSVSAIRLDEFIRERDLKDPLFIKMDIEAAEFRVVPALLPALKDRRFTLYVSTHPLILWRSMSSARGLGRLWRRARLIHAQLRLMRALREVGPIRDCHSSPLGWAVMLPRILRGKMVTPEGAVIVSSARPATRTSPNFLPS